MVAERIIQKIPERYLTRLSVHKYSYGNNRNRMTETMIYLDWILEKYWLRFEHFKKQSSILWRVLSKTGRFDTLQGFQFTSTAMEITAIEWRRRWFIWIGFWRYIDRDLSISRCNLPYCGEHSKTGRFDTLQGRQFTNTTTEITTFERRRRWYIWIGLLRYIDRDMSISRSHLPYCGEYSKTGRFDTLQGCQFTTTTTEKTAIERRRRWCIWIGLWRIIDRDMSVSKSYL